MRPEEDAFIEKLYQDTFRLLWVYAMSKLNNPALAQEVVQDAFLEAVKNIDVRFSILREYIGEGVQAMADREAKNKYAYLDQLTTEEYR